jgi:hypothetical protein
MDKRVRYGFLKNIRVFNKLLSPYSVEIFKNGGHLNGAGNIIIHIAGYNAVWFYAHIVVV